MTSIKPKKPHAQKITAYDLLGCPPAASIEQLHEAYLQIAFSTHPDRGGDGEKFKAVALAWGQVKMTEERRRYDRQLKLEGVLNCLPCKGRGVRSYFERGRFKKDAVCLACKGTGRA
jgi:curved DNA-binding protein CbpA